jgi:hypothetical protein
MIAYEHNRRLDIARHRSAEPFGPHNCLGPSSDVSRSPSTRVARTATRTASRETRLALGNHRTAPTDSPLLRIASPCPVPRRCPHGPAIQRPSGGDAHLTAPEPSKVRGCTSVESLDLRLARDSLRLGIAASRALKPRPCPPVLADLRNRLRRLVGGIVFTGPAHPGRSISCSYPLPGAVAAGRARLVVVGGRLASPAVRGGPSHSVFLYVEEAHRAHIPNRRLINETEGAWACLRWPRVVTSYRVWPVSPACRGHFRNRDLAACRPPPVRWRRTRPL